MCWGEPDVDSPNGLYRVRAITMDTMGAGETAGFSEILSWFEIKHIPTNEVVARIGRAHEHDGVKDPAERGAKSITFSPVGNAIEITWMDGRVERRMLHPPKATC